MNQNKWTVGEWTSKNPCCVPPHLSVREAFIKMRQEGFRHLLVVKDSQLLGIVTDRDLRRPDITDKADGWNDFYDLDNNVKDRSIMTIDLIVLSSKDSLKHAIKIFVEKKLGAIPVVDDNKLAGIITRTDALVAFNKVLKDME